MNSVFMNKRFLRKKGLLFILLLFYFCPKVISQIRLPHFFSDNMVLQQNDTVAIWGTDAAHKSIALTTSWSATKYTTSDKNGKWRIEIITPIADNKKHQIWIKGSSKAHIKNVMLGEVWFASGQSNMTMYMKGGINQPIAGSNESILNSANPRIRMWTSNLVWSETPQDNIKGSWQVASPSTTHLFSAVGYFFAKSLEGVLDVPIGIILSGRGGTEIECWMDSSTLSQFSTFSFLKEKENKDFERPTVQWNAMINPFVGYKVKGMIWYQGESNWEKPSEYSDLFPTMIKTWRKKWGQGDFPFYYVQIAPKFYNQGNSAFLREVQEKTLDKVDHVGMVVTQDVGECSQIHPREKRIIGERLAYCAFYNDYGIKTIGHRSPRYDGMVKGVNGILTLEFDTDRGGLTSFDKKLTGFQVAGPDKVFYDAEAHIKWRSSKVEVRSNKVKNPISARYLFDNCGEATLYSSEGLPVGPFRTDDWPEESYL